MSSSAARIFFFFSLVLPALLVGFTIWQLAGPSVLHYRKCARKGTPLDYCTYDRGNLVTCIYETERNIRNCEKYLKHRVGKTICTFMAAGEDYEPFSPKCVPCEITSITSAVFAVLPFLMGIIWIISHCLAHVQLAHYGQSITGIICSVIIIALQIYLYTVWKNEYEHPIPMPANVNLTLTKGPVFYSNFGLISSATLILLWNGALLGLSVANKETSV